IWAQLKPLARDTSPFGETGPGGREDHWVEPKLVCEVRFTEWTADGGLRHPAYLGLRGDKRPEDVVRERTPAEIAGETPEVEEVLEEMEAEQAAPAAKRGKGAKAGAKAKGRAKAGAAADA